MANTTDLLSQRFESQRQKLIAMDIVAVASSLGINLKQGSGGHLYWDEHDSFHIYPQTNTFRWWSRSVGTNTIDLVQVIQEELTGKKPSFRETVSFLETGQFESVMLTPIVREPFKHYLAPYEHHDFDLGRQYLKEERGLSDETIDFALASGSMSSATLKKGDYFEPVIIFKSFAEDGRMIGGSLQGIVENKVQHPERGRLKQIMKHSDGLAGFHLDIGTPKRLVFSEAPIDLLSYYELHKESLQNVRLVAMDGVKKGVISRYTADLLTDGQYSQTMPRESIRGAIDAINQTTRILKNNPNLITIAVDNDEAGLRFIKELQEDGIPITVDLPPRQENQEKMDWNDYLKQKKGLLKMPQTEGTQKAPDTIQGQTKKTENPVGDLPEESQEAAPLPNAQLKRSLNESSPIQTQSQSLLHFTISEAEKSIYKQGYHPISTKELNKLNRYASQIQENASWYQSELADSQVTYFYKNENQLQALQVSFKPEHYPHLIGLFAINENQTAAKTLIDLVEGKGSYQNIMIANRGATFSKIQVLPDFKAVIDANSFIFDDLSEVERMNRLDLAKAIRTEDRDVLIAFRNVDGEFFPASLMKVTNKLESDLSVASNKAILGVVSEKDDQVNILSINNQYITDGGQALKDMIVNRELEPIQTENLQEKGNQKTNYPKDSDGDGLTDDEEIALGTNPFSSDSDGDGTPDNVEKANGTDPTNASDNEVTRQQEANKRDFTLSEMIKAKNTAALNQHLQDGIKQYFDSDTYKQYLEGMAHFNNYSPRNIQLIMSQFPEASMVASFQEWKKRNGSVKKGEKAIYIQAPVAVIQKDKNGKPILNPETGEKETITYFKPVPVFDIKQISPQEGKELNLPKAMGTIPEQLDKDYYQNVYRSLRDISQNNNKVPIRFRELGQEDGFYSPQTNEIVIKKGMSYERTLSTLIHEMAHSELHNKQSLTERFDGQLTRSTKELQAESIAYVVSSHLGFDTSQESFPYLASWSKEKDGLANLTAQLEIVQAEAKSLMERIDHQLSQYQTVTLNKETQQLTKQEMKKQSHPFYQSLAAAKTSRTQVTIQEKEASVKKDNRPTMP
ncbi:toprim domain-containing protein [Streptococcus equi subsp. zooepidemicus]|uniref:PBECR4 domain-containing protein n=1 Tax=Streptococcus equi TaxID=1336 RepID=UPI001E5B9D60|nr:PBECR4 domain-containing protein [Streptococcus equi]MCD3438007.1 toprim domain-containing protein [Streptococcus equi subsp. zooepidemicus]